MVINRLGSGIRHTVVSLDGRTEARQLLAPGTRARCIDGRPFRAGGLRAVWRFLNEEKPDLLLTCNWGSIDWALARPRLCHLHQEHGFGAEEAAGQLPRRVWVRRLALRRAWRVVVPSRSLALAARRSWWVPEARLVRIPNGVPPGDARRRAGGGGPVVIGTVAPLRPEKRLDWLLRALAQVGDGPAWRLLIAGDGPERGRLEAEAARLGLADRVAFLGHQREPRRTLADVDLYALSSATEQLPMSLLDAMALGLPVAGVRVGDVADAVAVPNRPYIAPPHDLSALARSLRALLADEALRARLGAANRERQRERYGEASMRDAYAGLIESALRGPARSQPEARLAVA